VVVLISNQFSFRRYVCVYVCMCICIMYVCVYFLGKKTPTNIITIKAIIPIYMLYFLRQICGKSRSEKHFRAPHHRPPQRGRTVSDVKITIRPKLHFEIKNAQRPPSTPTNPCIFLVLMKRQQNILRYISVASLGINCIKGTLPVHLCSADKTELTEGAVCECLTFCDVLCGVTILLSCK